MKKMLIVFCFVFAFPELFAEVKLASLFTDNMVLQRNKTINIWGTADKGEKIIVRFNSRIENTVADGNGKWKVKMPSMEAGGPYDLVVESTNQIVLKNILVGEVWICSGQSNMEFSLKKSENGKEEIIKANYPQMRFFIVKLKVAETPQENCDGKWEICSPKTVPNFSAVAYYFGKNLFDSLNIPIGLIQTTWGGTSAEAWTSRETLESDEEFKTILTSWDKKMLRYSTDLEFYEMNKVNLLSKWKIDSVAAIKNGFAPPRKPNYPEGPGTRNTPSGLYNGMVYPLAPFTFQGVIWYQGEANVSRAFQYRKLFPAMINDWRRLWNQDDFPFYFVQLPNFTRSPEPSKSGWPEIREAQLMTLSVPNTGMVVTIDIGDAVDLHPKNKKDVGYRLSLIALDNVYDNDEIFFSGPIYDSFKISGSKIIVKFKHTANGLISKNSRELKGFVIAGSDDVYLPAKAIIINDEIIVWNERIDNPLNVRYAWADNPDANLYNSALLPASPFRTDSQYASSKK